jgi:uncharacterized protein (TIGR02145 family)
LIFLYNQSFNLLNTMKHFCIILCLAVVAMISCQKEEVPEEISSSVTDIDGNQYRTIKLGVQWWMAENLKTSRFNNGNIIPEIQNGVEWFNNESAAWCHYDNDAQYDAVYGKLYNFYAVKDSRNICPAGWHVPSHTEWEVLERFLGKSTRMGGDLKQQGTTHWYQPNVGATDKYGFGALPGGRRYVAAAFTGMRFEGHWWTSTEAMDNTALTRALGFDSERLEGDAMKLGFGYSVRCVRD